MLGHVVNYSRRVTHSDMKSVALSQAPVASRNWTYLRLNAIWCLRSGRVHEGNGVELDCRAFHGGCEDEWASAWGILHVWCLRQ